MSRFGGPYLCRTSVKLSLHSDNRGIEHLAGDYHFRGRRLDTSSGKDFSHGCQDNPFVLRFDDHAFQANQSRVNKIKQPPTCGVHHLRR